MRIGIDIDDVITNTSESMKEYIIKYDEDGDVKAHIEEVMRGEMPTEKIRKFFDNNSAGIFRNAKVKEDASNVMKRLIDKGHELFIITSRGGIKFKGSEEFTIEEFTIEEFTIEYFKQNNINYTDILFNSFKKAKVCEEKNIDIMIDDSVKYCEEISKKNIKSILFTS